MLTKGSRAASSADELKVPSFIMQESISPPGRNLALKFKDYFTFMYPIATSQKNASEKIFGYRNIT